MEKEYARKEAAEALREAGYYAGKVAEYLALAAERAAEGDIPAARNYYDFARKTLSSVSAAGEAAAEYSTLAAGRELSPPVGGNAAALAALARAAERKRSR
jgi:hypothetical protein